MKKMWLLVVILGIIIGLIPINVVAQTSEVDEILASMSNEDKIAQMIMPAFRKKSNVNINNANIQNILSTYGFAGVILFAENTPDIESTMRIVNMLQDANKNNASRLFIGIDQEGGYVTRLGIGTNMPGNMALAATNDPDYAYKSGKIIGEELKKLGINTNFAPVVDVNSNPANPVIGIRSYSDDPTVVSTYGEKFMEGLHSVGIMTSLKHFPGHGDTSTDTHTGLSIINKNYNQIKNNELIPFQELIDSGTDMIMTAHIQFPNIETDTYISNKDNQSYTLPATLSKTILTDILRDDMGYEGIIITDALDMNAISENFGIEDASIRAINAGANILLMPFTYDSDIDDFKAYIQSLASKVGNEINEDNVNSSVRRILKLKEENGLLEDYDGSNLEEDIIVAKNLVSNKDNHNKEFEITKKSITMLKNGDNVLPLDSNDKTVILYEYSSHIKAVSNALTMLKNDGTNINENNISLYPFYNNTGALPTDEVKEQVADAKNVIMIHSLYNTSGQSDPDLNKMNEIIDYVHENGGKVVAMSTQLPYDVVKFKNADAIVVTYLANGIRFDLDDYNLEIPKYGPNVMAGIYMLFSQNDNMNGVLPVNIYELDNNNNYTDNIVYARGFGLKYLSNAYLKELNKLMDEAKELLNNDKDYTKDSRNDLKDIYNKVLEYKENNKKILEDKQDEVDKLVLKLKNAINNLEAVYKIIKGNRQYVENGKDLEIVANGDYDDFVMLEVDGKKIKASYYKVKSGSTIVTLKSSYLDTLSVGKHTLTFDYDDGSVDATFTVPSEVNNVVKAKSFNNPNTGDNIVGNILLTVLSIIALIVLSIFTKKNEIR